MSAGVRSYASSWSCIAGQAIPISLSTDAPLVPAAYALEVRDAISNSVVYGPVALNAAAIPVIATQSRHADENGYNWPVNATVLTAASWSSGLYFAQVTAAGSPLTTSRSFFVVRATPGSPNRILVHFPFATWLAYEGVMGARQCLYDSDEHYRCRRVTTRKPMVLWTADDSTGVGVEIEGSYIQSWLSTKGVGFGADACCSWDLHSDPATLGGYELLILAGHDEYWSYEMRNNVEAFVAAGGRVAIFSGNNVWWQIRFSDDGSQMICYKSVLEDPLLARDNRRISANWAAQPAGRPENRINGASFRYGYNNGGGMVSILPPLPGEIPHPAFNDLTDAAGAPVTSFGPISGGEADGIDIDFSDPLHPKPTLRDGTPDTFVLLGHTDPGGNAPHGRGAIGYYDNVGTVFLCPFTNWVPRMAQLDPGMVAPNDVERVTWNVIQWLLDRSPQPGMGPSRAVVPPSEWSEVDGRQLDALTASHQGRIFAVSGENLLWRHPDLATGWVPVAVTLPGTGTVSALGTDLYNYRLLIATGNRLFYLVTEEGATNEPTFTDLVELAPLGVGESFLGVTGLDHYGTVYALVQSASGEIELRAQAKFGEWTSIGDATGLRSLCAAYGYLIASTTENRLVARMAGSLDGDLNGLLHLSDLTWIDLGSAPGIFSLGHYFGCLYALAKDPKHAVLLWRQLIPPAALLPVRHGRLLFYNGESGWYATGRFLANGDYDDAGSAFTGTNWTHVVPVNDGMVLFYSSDTGIGVVGRVEQDATFTELTAASDFGAWDIVVSDGRYTVFYSRSGEGYVGCFDPQNGAYINTDYRTDFSGTWISAAVTWGVPSTDSSPNRRGKFFVFYAPDGSLALATVDGAGKFATVGSGSVAPQSGLIVPAGQLGIFAYDPSSGQGEFGEVIDGNPVTFQSIARWPDATRQFSFEQMWNLGSARNGLVFFYRKESGVAVTGGFGRDGQFRHLNQWDPGEFLSNWTHIIGIE